MKYLIAVCLMSLMSCSHAYVSKWDQNEITVCCPQKKLFCQQEALDDLAKDQCHGSAKQVSGGSKSSGMEIHVNKWTGHADVGDTRDICTTYMCN